MSATEPAARIHDWQARFDRVLEQRLPPETHHPQQLHQAMRYSALAGGKRFRPVLVYATGQALGLGPEALDPVAAAIEIIHAYSLIHDDLPAMDDDDMRRGRATCHRAFDEATAILAGDALQALAFEVLARELPAGKANSLQAVHLIARACGSVGMAGGQALDLGSVGRDISVDALETMHRLKTGALIRASVAAPCLLAEVGEDVVGRLEAYGDCVGLAFQVHDDILDVTGNSEVTGKAVLADAALDKPTFPSILGLDASRQRARELRDQAIDHLAAVPGDTSMLAWLAAYVIRRDR
jgi:geranylgeranyl pyrophosphate synthase